MWTRNWGIDRGAQRAMGPAMNKRTLTTLLALALCLTFTGCDGKLLNRSYSTSMPHSAAYWENEDADTLRAETYQDLVNALLILVGEHAEDGVVRYYGDQVNKSAMTGDACVEVQKETALGSYLLDYITYSGKTENGYYELSVHVRYRRTAQEQSAIVNATSTEALPDLLREAIENGQSSLAVRFGYFGTDRDGLLAMVGAVHDEVYPPEPTQPDASDGELPAEDGAEQTVESEDMSKSENAVAQDAPQPDDAAQTDGAEDVGGEEPAEMVYDLSPWTVLFYPDNEKPGIVEVILKENPDA